jgi:uncharacterized repeat protein (TIGR01451 family)
MPTRETYIRKDSRLFAELCSDLLRRGHRVEFRVQGESMGPNLIDGDNVVVAPVAAADLRRGDIAFLQNIEGLRVHRVAHASSADASVITRSDTSHELDAPATRTFGKVLLRRRGLQEESFTLFRNRILHPARVVVQKIRVATQKRLQRASFLLFGLIGFLVLSAAVTAPAAHAQADLTMTQVASVSSVATGTNYTYTEVATNNGPNSVPTGTIVVYQQTPPNATYRSVTGTNWTCTTPAVGNSGPITCTYNAVLASGTTAPTIVITERITAGTAAGTSILNSATVTSQTQDPVPTNNTTVTTVVVEPAGSSDAGVSMTVAPTPVFVFSNFTYTIQVTNLGQAGITALTTLLSDTIPAGTTFVSSTPPAGWTCSGTATVQCGPTGTMASGTSATVSITVTAPAGATALSNTATVTVAGDPNSNNNNATVITVVQPIVCASPGKDGAPATPLTGIVNTYFSPSATGNLAAGSTSVALGAGTGAATPIAVNDLLLIIQAQDSAINRTNSSSYGDGLPGDPATGSSALANSGNFEFVTATSAVAIGGGTLNFKGSGATSGLLNTYTKNAATGTQGQQSFQVIRVPQYTSATLSSGLVPLAWNGSVGGVLAIDVSSQLTLAGTVALDALGFRGGGGRILTGTGTGTNTDYVTLSTNLANGSKGEGIAGTPAYIAPATITTTTTATNTGVEGLPAGSYARGAPGNAGGGGTDGDPSGNTENSGGGAGGNGGSGGLGGYGWNTFTALNSTDGGFGGAAFPATTSSLVMGGSGGAGSTNNGSYYISAASHDSTTTNAACANVTCTGIYSSGGAGGGIVIVHAGSVVGSGTITSNGSSTLSTDNDSTGGGGAGGSILFFANSGTLGGLSASANGGSAGNTWPEQAPGAFPGNRHGPGGGGGGGVILLSASPASMSVKAGNNGFTNTAQDSYGATPGSSGVTQVTHVITETPGTQAGAYCAGADLSVTNVGTPPVVAPGGSITYTQIVTNGGPFDAVNAIFSETIPANTTFTSIVTPAGWTCATPAVGATGNISCTNLDVSNGGTSTFTVVVTTGALTTNGTQIVDVDNIISGTSDPNLANNSATVITTVGVGTSADLSMTNMASSPTVLPGANVTMTGVVTNNGPAIETNATFTEAIPANTTLGTAFVAPTNWTCNTIPIPPGTGTLTCFLNSGKTIAVGASVTFPLVLKVNAGATSGTVISATANVASSVPDSNPTNNSATATTTVGTSGQADLAVTSSATPNPVSQGNNITYVQSVTNNGPAVETNATFTDTIPTNTTLVSFTPPANWTCNTIAPGGTGTFTCTLNASQTIAVGASVSFPLVVNVNPTTPPSTSLATQIKNSPAVASTVGDPTPGNNTVNVYTVVAAPTQSDVSIVKTASPEPVNQGTNLAYTLKVTNGGPAIAQGVKVTDSIPAEVTYSSVFTSQGMCTYTAPQVTCQLGSIAVGSVAIITINVTASTFSSGALSSNTAFVSSTTTDLNTLNNQSTAVSTIQSPTAVDISFFHAFAQPDGSVMLEWHTHEESRNLGFHIYREDATGRKRINPSLIAGSALLLRGSKPQHAAKVYRWIDSQPSAGASYSIEDVDLNGTRTTHGPVNSESLATASANSQTASFEAARSSALLSQIRSAAPTATPNARLLITPRPILPILPLGSSRFTLADLPAVKISVDHEGWYHISVSQLFSEGLDPTTDLRTLHLYAEGVEQPLLLTGGSSSSAGGPAAIEFYGTGIDTPFTGSRVYWLVREEHSPKRILSAASPASGSAAPAGFPFTVIREDRTLYFAALLNGETNDNFFGAMITSDPVDQTLEVAHSDASSALPITLDLTMQGGTEAQAHSVSVQFNGATIGEMDFFSQALFQQTFNVEPSLLIEGTNTVTLTALNGDNDVSVVQSIELHYPHTYTADANWLKATAPSGSAIRVAGFTNSQIRAFDITDPLNITELSGKVSPQSGAFVIDLVLPHSGPAERTILTFSSDAMESPVAFTPHAPSFLDEQRAGSDVVIITHPDFASSLAPLVKLRESQGHHVSLVTTDQLYDQYNFGERTPFAIRNFLQDAQSRWQRKPQAVLLVGDASFDPRDYLGLGAFDYVPTRLIETTAFKTASDDWFTDFKQNGYATIPTGRLPVRTQSDAELMVSKILGYEQGHSGGTWNSQALIVADQNVDSNFSSASTSAAANLPATLQVTKILADGVDPSTAHSQILAALNSGSLLVNYAGHGAEQQWSFEDFFNTDDAAALTNGDRLPVYLLMDCLNGFFQDVYAQSLAESLVLAPNGGAVAVWASSGFTQEPPQSSMNQAFILELATHPNSPLGQIILQAKSGITDNDVRRTWILFGDPAMKFQFSSSTGVVNASQPVTSPNIPVIPKGGCSRESACFREKVKP